SPLRFFSLPTHTPNNATWTGSGAGKNKINTRLSAQCYPRHACPLYGAVLMQLPDVHQARYAGRGARK
ncbi:hypothetical protein ACVXER_004476, partial [Citrobacter freundii]